MWDAQTGNLVSDPFKGHTDEVTSVAFSPDGKYIVSGSYNKTIRMLDAQTGKLVFNPSEGHIESVTSAAFSPDGKGIVLGSYDDTLQIRNHDSDINSLFSFILTLYYITYICF